MKFNVSAGVLSDAIFPCLEVATKNVNKDFVHAEKITLKAKQKELIAISHGGRASIILSISKDTVTDLNYECGEEGQATIKAVDFSNSLEAIPPAELMQFDLIGNELILSYKASTKDKHKEKQTISILKEEVKPPVISKIFKQEVIINREIFVSGVDRVKFAIGFAKTMPYYMVELFEIEPGKARFAAGTGARFAVLDVEGKCIKDVKEKEQFFFPKDCIANMIKVLSHSTETDITIKYADANYQGSKNPAQIVIEFSKGGSMILLGIDPSVTYPVLDNVIKFDYPYSISSELSDWQYVVKGINATYNADIKAENDIHNPVHY